MATDNRIDLNLAQNTTGWLGDDAVTVTTAAGDFYQGGTALSTQLSDALEHMYTTSIGGTRDMSNASVWFLVKDNLQQSNASGGAQIVIGDTTDRVGFYCNGNDSPGLSLPSYYNCLKLDVSNRASLGSNVYAGVLGNLTVTAITEVGYGTIHAAKANGAIDNVWMDASRFIVNTNYALTIDGGTVGTPIVFADVVTSDVSGGWGMISNLQGDKFDVNASWEWGAAVASPNADSYFNDEAFQVYIDARDMGAGNFIVRTRAGTGTNSLVLTDGLFINLGTPSVWDLSDADMNTLQLSRVTFTGIGSMTLATASAGNRYLRNCVFNNAGQLDVNGMEVTDCSFNGGNNANGALILNVSTDATNLSNAAFSSDGTGHAIEITAAGTYTFDALTFTGYGSSGTTDAAVYISANVAVTINIVNGGDTPTVRNSGTAPTINNAVTVAIESAVEGSAYKFVAAATLGTVTLGDTLDQGLIDSLGAASFSINYEGAFGSGLPVDVRIRNQGLPNAAIAEDGGVFTDETANANSKATGDMTLTPATPAVNDAYYFGHSEPFEGLKLLTDGNGSGFSYVWEFWNGASWATIPSITDGFDGGANTTITLTTYPSPSGWATTTVNSQGPYFYIRLRVTAVTTPTQVLGAFATLDVTRYLPFDIRRNITASGLTVTAQQTVDSIGRFNP